jgi:hypothetical protein
MLTESESYAIQEVFAEFWETVDNAKLRFQVSVYEFDRQG